MPLLIESIVARQDVTSLLRDTIINSFGILLGMCFRDFIMDLTEYLNPGVKTSALIFSLFILLLVLFITLVIIICWT